jgi:hypothetical protein
MGLTLVSGLSGVGVPVVARADLARRSLGRRETYPSRSADSAPRACPMVFVPPVSRISDTRFAASAVEALCDEACARAGRRCLAALASLILCVLTLAILL